MKTTGEKAMTRTARLEADGSVSVGGKVVGEVRRIARGRDGGRFRALLGRRGGVPTQSTFASAREAAAVVALNVGAVLEVSR